MAKVKAYIRIAKNGPRFKTVAGNKPNNSPLKAQTWPSDRVLPTVSFAVVFDVPDEEFKAAERVLAEITIPRKNIKIATELA